MTMYAAPRRSIIGETRAQAPSTLRVVGTGDAATCGDWPAATATLPIASAAPSAAAEIRLITPMGRSVHDGSSCFWSA